MGHEVVQRKNLSFIDSDGNRVVLAVARIVWPKKDVPYTIDDGANVEIYTCSGKVINSLARSRLKTTCYGNSARPGDVVVLKLDTGNFRLVYFC